MPKKDKPTSKVMSERKKEWLSNEDNNAHRLISTAKLKDFVKAIDPEGRMDGKFHDAAVKELTSKIVKAMKRCYGNKRTTLRGMDL